MTKKIIITDQNISEFFHQKFREECENTDLYLSDEGYVYVVNLAVRFLNSEQLFLQEGHQKSLPTLAYLYKDALAAETKRDRVNLIRTLGDTALFLAAFFPNVWQRRGISRTYFISMSENAFQYLALTELNQGFPYRELSEKNEAIANCLGKVIKR